MPSTRGHHCSRLLAVAASTWSSCCSGKGSVSVGARVGKSQQPPTVTIIAARGLVATPAAMATAAAIHGRRLASLKKSAGLSASPSRAYARCDGAGRARGERGAERRRTDEEDLG